MTRRVVFDPAASIGIPIAKNTIPKNGGGNGKNANPMTTEIPPPAIKQVDLKRPNRRTEHPLLHRLQ